MHFVFFELIVDIRLAVVLDAAPGLPLDYNSVFYIGINREIKSLNYLNQI